MTLQGAIKHAQAKSENKDLAPECAEEHRKLAGWLRELEHLRGHFTPYIKEDLNMLVFKKDGDGEWVPEHFHALTAGSVFQIRSKSGKVQGKGTDFETCVAQGVPFITESAEAGVYIWGIMVKSPQGEPEQPADLMLSQS